MFYLIPWRTLILDHYKKLNFIQAVIDKNVTHLPYEAYNN